MIGYWPVVKGFAVLLLQQGTNMLSIWQIARCLEDASDQWRDTAKNGIWIRWSGPCYLPWEMSRPRTGTRENQGNLLYDPSAKTLGVRL